MAKSMNKKIAAYQRNMKGERDQSKRDNPNRAKHGCSRLHALNEQKAAEELKANEIKVIPDSEPKESTGKKSWFGKFKRILGQ